MAATKTCNIKFLAISWLIDGIFMWIQILSRGLEHEPANKYNISLFGANKSVYTFKMATILN